MENFMIMNIWSGKILNLNSLLFFALQPCYRVDSSLTDWIVFYVAFNSISVISRRQLTSFMSSLGFTSTRLGLWSVLPNPTKKPRGSSVTLTQDPLIKSQTLYHWAMQDPFLTNCWPIFQIGHLGKQPLGYEKYLWRTRLRIHQPFSRTFFVFFFKIC